MFKYVLTGGHGVGKTSLLLYLQYKGQRIIRETSSDYKYIKRAMGILFPFDHDGAESDIVKMQLQQENNVPSEFQRVFLDRSVIDCSAYAKILNQQIDPYIQYTKSGRYDLVFHFQPGNFGITECTRREIEFSKKVSETIFEEYKKYGYTIIEVPAMPLEERYNFIMEKVQLYER